jgi:hypothetical protein
MATGRKQTPDFFNEKGLDPVESATGYGRSAPGDKIAPSHETGPSADPPAKKKAGFYLSVQVLDRFNLKFHELKLAGVAIDNKSMLLEAALSFALDDMDKGGKSRVLKRFG